MPFGTILERSICVNAITLSASPGEKKLKSFISLTIFGTAAATPANFTLENDKNAISQFISNYNEYPPSIFKLVPVTHDEASDNK